jgi:hypothetical protein
MTVTEERSLLPQVFSINGSPVLSAGNINTLLAKAPALWAHVKIYATGGENGQHLHPNEDHMFLVMAGEATFTDHLGRESVVEPFGGVMLPRNTTYSFRSSGSQNLIMLRVGTCTDTAMLASDTHSAQGIPELVRARLHPGGEEFSGKDPANKTGSTPGVPIPGSTFSAPESLR